MSFDVKMEYFHLKDRLVAGGNVIEPPATITYSMVFSMETASIALALADLNDFIIKVTDIQNAYITAPVTEKIWTNLGLEFGEYAGRKSIIGRALYGLKIAGAAFQKPWADCIHYLEFLPFPSNLDLWMTPMVRPGDDFIY